ncbi:MAG: PIN domain-containing protein [Spirochaetaceae bacterium]
MKYILDTNIVSYWMRGDEHILPQIKMRRPCDLAITLITYAEICFGIRKSKERSEEREKKFRAITSTIEILTMDIEAAHHYADIRVALEHRGEPISERDLQIAAVARSLGLTVVTHNTREFYRIPDLEVEDWWQ